MKSSDKPEISKKWWVTGRPADIKGLELEKALASAERALAEEKKASDPRSVDTCLAALKDVSSAIDKTIKKECERKRHKELIAVLEKFFPLIKVETGRLDELKKKSTKSAAGKAGGGEEEEDEGKLFDPEYLFKMLKLLRSTGNELNFAFGLNAKDPAASQLLVARKGKPEKLFKILKQKADFSNRLITYGKVLPDAQDGKTLVFKLAESAGEPPRIQKLGRQFLRSDKGLRFRKLKLVLPDGKTLEDAEPDMEENDAAARGTRAETSPAAADGEGVTVVQENLRKEFKQARARWVKVRSKAEHDLEVVKDGVRDYYLSDLDQFPIAMKKLKELDEIMDHLNDELRDALDAYVSTPLRRQDQLQERAANARQLLDRFSKYVDDSPLMAAIDKKEFADVEMKAPLVAAMRDLARTIE